MNKATNIKTALQLASLGFSVFPCQPGGKQIKQPMPFIKWRDVSTTDTNQINIWWQKWPTAAIGLDLAKSNLLVIDCDRHSADDGVALFGSLCNEHQYDIDQSPLVATPNDGMHVYFKQKSDKARGNKRGGLPAGIDVRGSGGYVIAPGTIMSDGRFYELSGNLDNIPIVPDWLVTIIDNEEPQKNKNTTTAPIKVDVTVQTKNEQLDAYCKAAIENEVGKVASASKGERNNTLNEAAFSLGQLVGANWIDENQIFDQLLDAAISVGLGLDEAKKTIVSGLKAGKNKPRPLPNLSETREIFEDTDGTLIDSKTGEVISLKKEPEKETTSLPYPPGLVGDIAKWIVSTARFPQPELAIGAAISIVGTFAGRLFAGPTRSATHLYVLGLAGTGKGKDHALQQIMRIMGQAGATRHIGPSEFISMPAVINFLTRKPLSICVMDEFGDFMKRINSKRASGFEAAISKVLRTLWSSSFAPFVTPEWASKESVTIFCPAITIYGTSTPEQFYSSMEAANIENGTLNRFLMLSGQNNVREVDPAVDPTKVPAGIIDKLKKIYNRLGELATSFRDDATIDPAAAEKIIVMNWCSDGSHETYKNFSDEISKKIEEEPETASFYARTAEMALRVATIIAIGRLESDQIYKKDMEYGIKLASQSAKLMLTGAADYMSDNENQANAQKILRAIKNHSGRMSYRSLVRSLHNSIRARDLKDIITSMCDSGQIEKEEVKSSRGPSAIWYRYLYD